MTDCKYMRADEDYTPNNYLLNFDYNKQPSNVTINPSNINLRTCSPLTKKIHLVMNTDLNNDSSNRIGLKTSLNCVINDETVEVNLK